MTKGYFCQRCRRAFFPQLAELGLRVEATVSRRVEQKMVYAGAGSTNFEQARKDLLNLANLNIKTERVRRATTRNGKARIALTRLLEQADSRTTPRRTNQSRGPADRRGHV